MGEKDFVPIRSTFIWVYGMDLVRVLRRNLEKVLIVNAIVVNIVKIPSMSRDTCNGVDHDTEKVPICRL